MMTVIDKDGVPTGLCSSHCVISAYYLARLNNPNNKPEETEESFKTMGKLAQCYVMSGQLELAVTLLKRRKSKSFPTSGRNHTSVV